MTPLEDFDKLEVCQKLELRHFLWYIKEVLFRDTWAASEPGEKGFFYGASPGHSLWKSELHSKVLITQEGLFWTLLAGHNF